VSGRFGESAARERFAALLAREDVPLAAAALVIAQEEYPGLPVDSYLDRLDALAEDAERRLARGGSPRTAASLLRVVRGVLFDEQAFRGNVDAYYDPRNSFLNEVLDRKLGIPITLGILFIEVAARVGVTLYGVNFPGHFLVKYTGEEAGLEAFIDPFNGGEMYSADECAERFRRLHPARSFDVAHLRAVTTRQILARLLHNLKKIYVETGDDVRALWVVDRLVMLAPDDAVERRDRGLIEARLGGTRAALGDLEAYLAASPDAEDAETVRGIAAQLRGSTALLN
jgi:regulator of sirC expression with transglutaminase-like and TPR domain